MRAWPPPVLCSVSQFERDRIYGHQSGAAGGSIQASFSTNCLTHLKTTATRICQSGYILRGRWPVTATVIILTVVITLFAAFAGALAWAQQHARQLSTAPVDVPRPRRRPF